jgi:hypothetical protein
MTHFDPIPTLDVQADDLALAMIGADSVEIFAISLKIDQYLEDCQNRSYTATTERLWNELQSVSAYTSRYATVANGLARFAEAMASYIRKQAIANAWKRRLFHASCWEVARRNSFMQWGKAHCIYRCDNSIRAMESGRASARQYAYWYKH